MREGLSEPNLAHSGKVGFANPVWDHAAGTAGTAEAHARSSSTSHAASVKIAVATVVLHAAERPEGRQSLSGSARLRAR